MTLQSHALAEIFPLMTGRRFDELVDDIRCRGLLEPIVLLDGKILDGRNRARAADAARIEVRTEVFSGDDPLAFVISKNLRRRQLNDSQRALIAARLANVGRGGGRNRGIDGVTREMAAGLLNARVRTIDSAKRVLRDSAPSVVSLVEGGGLSVAAAAAISHLAADEQERLVEIGPSAIVAAARTRDVGRFGRNNYAGLYSLVDQICEALSSRRLDLADVAAADLRKKIAEIVAIERGRS